MTPMTPLEHARDLLGRGLAPIPIPFRSKKPVVKSWTKLRLTADDLSDHFNADPANVGVLLGEPSDWVVDVDLDHPRAVELADLFLPPTGMTWGRASKPRSHREYRLTRPAKTRKWYMPKLDTTSKKPPMIVELRSTGCQSIAPGSVHPSGEAVRWDDDGEPATIDPDELITCLCALAEAVRGEKGMGSKGCRDSGVAGAFQARASVDEHHKPTPCNPVNPKDPIDPVDPVDPVRLTPEQVIDMARVDGPGQHDQQTFNLARGLRLNCGIVSVEAARGPFDTWWARSRSFCADQDPDAAWFKFVRAWELASIPLARQGVAAAVLAIADRLPDVPGLNRYGPKLRRLVNALAEMGRRTRGQPFAVSAHMVANALGVSPATAHVWIGGLIRERVVRCTDPGRAGAGGTGRARRLVYLGCQWASSAIDSGHEVQGGDND